MSRRKLGFESLEGRRVCAGDVSVSVVGGELRIVGDVAPNSVDVQLRTVQGQKQFVVTGLNFSGTFNSGVPNNTGDPTLINGLPDPFIAPATKVSVSLGGGNDALVMGGDGAEFAVAGLSVKMGAGNDYFKLKTAKVTSNVTSTVQMTDIAGPTGQTEAGNDRIVIDGFVSTLAGATLFTGGGDDIITAAHINAAGAGTAMNVSAGAGDDTFTLTDAALRDVIFNAADGTNSFSATGSSFHDVEVNGGIGSDTVSVSTCRFNNVTFNAGGGADRATLSKVTLNTVTANMGAGKDTITVTSTAAKSAAIDMGAGDGDLLNLVTEVGIQGRSILKGGIGARDELRIGNRMRVGAGNATITGFEIKPAGL